MEHEINKETLNELLEYIPETGDLIWKERGIEWFKSERSCKAWNSKFPNKKALAQIRTQQKKEAHRMSKVQQGYLLNKCVYKSRIVWIMHYGEIPDEMNISFKDKNPLNCKIENLECLDISNLCKKRQNRLNSISPFKGVSYDRKIKKWNAAITINGKVQYLGQFKTQQEAIEARKAANIKYGFLD